MSSGVALQSLRSEIDSLRKELASLREGSSQVIKRYFSGPLLPPAQNIPYGIADANRICTKEAWNGELVSISQTPATIPGMTLGNIILDTTADGLKIKYTFGVGYDSAAAMSLFRLEYTLLSYVDGFLVATTNGINDKARRADADDNYKFIKHLELEFSFQYTPWDTSFPNDTTPIFDVNGNLPCKGLPSNRSLVFATRVVGRELNSSNQVRVHFNPFLTTFPSSDNFLTWRNNNDTLGTSSVENVVVPYVEIVEYAF
jgi:hypothetical protein